MSNERFVFKTEDKLSKVTDTHTGDEFIFGDDVLAHDFVKGMVTDLNKEKIS